MVARRVIPPPFSRARWIVVPPFRHDGAWRAAVAEMISAAGLHLYDLDAAPEGAPLDDGRAVILTADAYQTVVAGVPAESVAGLMTEAGIRLDPDENPDTLPQHIQALTTLIGRISLLPSTRVFRSPDFASGSIEIFSGLKLQRPAIVPEPLSDRLQAVTEAVALLDPTHPEAIWAPVLFNYHSRLVPGGEPGQLDLTGRPRFVVTGPYIAMPAGRWRATYRLTFDSKGSRPRFRVDWGGTEDYVSEEFVPGRAGVFEVSQEYCWSEPGPCELRIVVLEGVFDGRMTFSGVEISRVG